mmetsp:Transcript_32601/g.84500  ORF Transcript_32601/g.84500 Transcript_32601/m.84500 type:complete len:416 (-) Transcript_32601:209-1456(-)
MALWEDLGFLPRKGSMLCETLCSSLWMFFCSDSTMLSLCLAPCALLPAADARRSAATATLSVDANFGVDNDRMPFTNVDAELACLPFADTEGSTAPPAFSAAPLSAAASPTRAAALGPGGGSGAVDVSGSGGTADASSPELCTRASRDAPGDPRGRRLSASPLERAVPIPSCAPASAPWPLSDMERRGSLMPSSPARWKSPTISPAPTTVLRGLSSSPWNCSGRRDRCRSSCVWYSCCCFSSSASRASSSARWPRYMSAMSSSSSMRSSSSSRSFPTRAVSRFSRVFTRRTLSSAARDTFLVRLSSAAQASCSSCVTSCSSTLFASASAASSARSSYGRLVSMFTLVASRRRGPSKRSRRQRSVTKWCSSVGFDGLSGMFMSTTLSTNTWSLQMIILMVSRLTTSAFSRMKMAVG